MVSLYLLMKPKYPSYGFNETMNIYIRIFIYHISNFFNKIKYTVIISLKKYLYLNIIEKEFFIKTIIIVEWVGKT
jgi:hypothetical protein